MFDGICDMTQQLAVNKTFKQAIRYQILTVKDLFHFCQENKEYHLFFCYLLKN